MLLEGDFQRAYGIDLREAYRSESCRRLWALLWALPEDSALWRLRDQEQRSSFQGKVTSIAEFVSKHRKHGHGIG